MELEPLPSVGIDAIVGLLERLDEHRGRADLYRLAEELRLPLDDLMPILDAARLLGFVILREGDIELTEIGAKMARSDIAARKEIFRRQVGTLPLFRYVLEVLAEAPSHRSKRAFFLAQLRRTISESWAERTMDTVISWGRYAELLGYKAKTGELYLMD